MNTTVKGLSPRRLFTLVAFVLTIFCFGRESRAQTQIIPQNQLSITGVDSEQSSYYRAANSIDGSANTMWHTTWQPVATLFPHQITLQLSTSYIVTGLRYLPRQDGNKNGIITSYAVYVSPDGIGWDLPVAQGTWSGDSALKEVKFVGKQGRYVRLVAKAAANQFPYTSAAEINLLGILPPTEPPKTSATVKNLAWVDSSTNEDGFKIERRINTTGTFVRLAVVGANTTTYSDKDTLAGTTYCYRVQAFNAAGSSDFSNEVCSNGQAIRSLSQALSSNLTPNPQGSATLVQSTKSSFTSAPTHGKGSNTDLTVSQQPLYVQIGVFRPHVATWHLDRNANGKFDGCAVDACPATFGLINDVPVVGDWNGSGTTQLGVFDPASQMWDLDKNGNAIWEACETDLCRGPFGTMADLPVSGYWRSGDKTATIGIYRPRTGWWILDLDGDGRLDLDSDDAHLGPFGMPTDLPIVGDWTGTGKTRIGTFTPQTGQWRLDLNGNGRFDNCTVDRCLGPFGKGTDYPVAADWTGDDTTKIGTFDPASGIWQLDSNGNGIFDGCVIDRCAGPFGTTGDLPVVGHW